MPEDTSEELDPDPALQACRQRCDDRDLSARHPRSLVERLFAEQIDAWAQVEDAAKWAERRISRPGWIAEIDGKSVGFSDLTPDGCLDMMFVHPAFQGLGVAGRLLTRVEEEAEALGIDRIYTHASLTSQPFFERKGFRILTRQTVERRGQRLDNFVMEKFYSGRS